MEVRKLKDKKRIIEQGKEVISEGQIQIRKKVEQNKHWEAILNNKVYIIILYYFRIQKSKSNIAKLWKIKMINLNKFKNSINEVKDKISAISKENEILAEELKPLASMAKESTFTVFFKFYLNLEILKRNKQKSKQKYDSTRNSSWVVNSIKKLI